MTDPNAGLFREVAAFVDAVDQEVVDANERKRQYYAGVKELLTRADFAALKKAIGIRRQRLKDRDGYDLHEGRVTDILFILEGEEPSSRLSQDQLAQKTAVAPVSALANGIAEETSPTRAARSDEIFTQPRHKFMAIDPETGEINWDEKTIADVPRLIGEHLDQTINERKHNEN